VPDSKGYTAMHYAATEGHGPCLTALHAAGANVNARDDYGTTPVRTLQFAACWAHAEDKYYAPFLGGARRTHPNLAAYVFWVTHR
jgi:hypothetical protein